MEIRLLLIALGVKNVRNKFHPLLIHVNPQLTDHFRQVTIIRSLFYLKLTKPNNLDLKQYIVKTVYAYAYSLCTVVPPPSDFF